MTDIAPAVQSDWLLSVADVADVIGISTRQVLREVLDGRLLCHSERRTRCKTHREFSVENVRDYLREWCPREMSPPAETRLALRLAA
jgi:hypothetical protein